MLKDLEGHRFPNDGFPLLRKVATPSYARLWLWLQGQLALASSLGATCLTSQKQCSIIFKEVIVFD